ncbi:MFS family permease [Arthrobacter pigmenti]|uniref:MFS family permease n=1 Tax=Arthrobacter pigmenti TaxID=271432 RepID=A0A846RHA7_9MICC|nr:MFS family permease [Arthrobacter pigmenti]
MNHINRIIAAAGAVGLSDGMLRAVLPLLAATVTLDPAAVAATTLFFSIPWLIVSIPFGPLVDRFDPVTMMRIINLTRFAGIGLLVGAVLMGDAGLPLLYVGAFVLGSAETLYEICAQVVVPRYVDKEDLPRKNGHLFGVTTSMGGFIGPAVGGLLVGLSAVWAVSASAVGYLAGVFILLSITTTAPTVPAARPRFLPQIREGFRYLVRDRSLLWLALIGGAATVCWYAWTAIFVLAVVDPGMLGLEPAAYGVFLAVLAAGSVTGSLVTGWLRKRISMRTLLVLSLLGWAVWFVAPGITANVYLVGVALFIGGFSGVTWNVLTVTLRQSTVPRELLGRVTAVYRTITRGGRPVGALLGGVVASAIGLQGTFVAVGVVAGLLTIPLAVTIRREAG